MKNLAEIKSDSITKGHTGRLLWLGFSKSFWDTFSFLGAHKPSAKLASDFARDGHQAQNLEFLDSTYPPLWGLGHMPSSICWHCCCLYWMSPGICYYSLSPGREMSSFLVWTSIKVIHFRLSFGCFQNTSSFLPPDSWKYLCGISLLKIPGLYLPGLFLWVSKLFKSVLIGLSF